MAEYAALTGSNQNDDIEVDNPYGIKYGWCYTDHKDGRSIRSGHRSVDYVQDTEYAASVAAMLKKMGLPQPDINQVYRGTHHDLLFLDDHGVVVRIGPTNVNDLVHPAIIQPLGWLDDKGKNISVAIYPGVELMKDFENSSYAEMKLNALREGLRRAGQGTNDVSTGNAGIIRVERNGVSAPLAILLDPDNDYNGVRSTGDLGNGLSQIRDSVSAMREASNKSYVLEDAITSISTLAQDMKDWETFFKSHQPLRTRFWLSQRDRDDIDTPNPEFMRMFWDECRSLKEKPKNYLQHKYTTYVNEHGVQVNRYTTYEIKNAALLSPWTKKEEDKRSASRPVAEHKRKIFADIAVDAGAFEKQHDFYKNNTSFVLQALNINPACYVYLSDEKKALPEVNILRLNRIYFSGGSVKDAILELNEQALAHDEVQRYILSLLDNRDIDKHDLPEGLRNHPEFVLKALPAQKYIFKVLCEDQPFAAERDFILKAVRIQPDIAEPFIDNFYEDPSLLWDCIRTNMRYDSMLKYAIYDHFDCIPDDLRSNINFVNRYVQIHDFHNKGYEILNHVDPIVAEHKAFKDFILNHLKDDPIDVRRLPPTLQMDKRFILRVLRAEPKVFFHLSKEMQLDEKLARSALYADYKRKSGVCCEVKPELLDGLYDGGDRKFKKYFYELCATMPHVFDSLPEKYSHDIDFILNVLDYGALNYDQFPLEMRKNHDISKKAILADLEENCTNVKGYIPDAVLDDRRFILSLLDEDERSFVCFSEFLLAEPDYMPDVLCENAEFLYMLAENAVAVDGALQRLFAMPDYIISEDIKKALSCQMAYGQRWDAELVGQECLADVEHIKTLLTIDSSLYHDLPNNIASRIEVMEAALMHDGGYDWSIIREIPNDTLETLSIWNNEEYLNRLSDGIASNEGIYKDLPRVLVENVNFSKMLLHKNVAMYKHFPYQTKSDEGVIVEALKNSERYTLHTVSNITTSLDGGAYNDLDIWFDASIQEHIYASLKGKPADFWILPECLKENKEFLCGALDADIKLFTRFDTVFQKDPDVLLKYFEVLGEIPEMARPDRRVFLPNELHHDQEFMSDVFAHIGFDESYLPAILSSDKAFFDKALLKAPRLLEDDSFMAYFNAAQYQRSIEDSVDSEKWFNNHLVGAFNEDLREAIEARAQKYDKVVKREDGLSYAWVANVCPNKVTENDGRILYNYAGQDNSEPLVYEEAIVGEAVNIRKSMSSNQVGIYKLVHD